MAKLQVCMEYRTQAADIGFSSFKIHIFSKCATIKQTKERQSEHVPESCSILNSHREHLYPCLGIPVGGKKSISRQVM